MKDGRLTLLISSCECKIMHEGMEEKGIQPSGCA